MLAVATLTPNSTLLGSSALDVAQIDQWIHLADTELNAPVGLTKYMCTGKLPYSKPTHTHFLQGITRAFATLNTHLASRTFLVGERLTVADLYVAVLAQSAFESVAGAEERKAIPHVVRFVETVIHTPGVESIFGEVAYADKSITFVPPKKEEKPKKEKEAKPKEVSRTFDQHSHCSLIPQQEKKPKEEKKPKKKEDDDEEDEPLVPEEPKQKNPLDELPKSTFNLEDWKRAYSNMETRGAGGALEWFYKKYAHVLIVS